MDGNAQLRFWTAISDDRLRLDTNRVMPSVILGRMCQENRAFSGGVNSG